MNIASAKAQIKDTVEAYLTKDDAGLYALPSVHQRPIFLLGAPGIGKTAIMDQIAEELGIGIVSYSMTHHTRQSALGLPRIEHHEFEGMEYEASEYTMSEIVAAIYDYIKATDIHDGILFLDEINCVSETLYPSMLQFLQFKTFGKHRIPQGWVVVCAGNPPEYNRSVHEFDIVTLDRMREIDVEPDYTSWKEYASTKGLHPSVTTFLETKRDRFYKVESKPGGGKAFVTARGWEDLAQVIALYETLDKPINRELIVQFLHDDETADAFAVYYELFRKYRTDYQVDTILADKASEEVKNRAHRAEFDERIALVSLMLDSLAGSCGKVLEQEGIVMQLRDTLRTAKEPLQEGQTVEQALVPSITEKDNMLHRRMASGVVSDSYVRRERLSLAKLREFVGACTLAKTEAGPAAFDTLQQAYKEEVDAIAPAADAASAQMDAAFAFIDNVFSDREMLIFVAELATRRATTQFISHYGNDSYYEHNRELQVDSARMGLEERVSLLKDLNSKIRHVEERGMDASGAVGLSGSGQSSSAKAYEPQAPDAAQGTDGDDKKESMRDFYHDRHFEYGFASMSRMVLPASELKGKTVLDVACRRGKGVYKLSSMVGQEGSALGVDWVPSYIQDAKDRMERAWHDNHLKSNNMEFRVAYPEDLIAAGIGSSTMDMVYINNVMPLLYDQEATIKEAFRVLRPGGLFVLETVYASKERDPEVVKAARAMGNSIQAALTEQQNLEWLRSAGFEEPEIQDEYEVKANRGYKADETVDTVPGDEDVKYRSVSLYIRKPQ